MNHRPGATMDFPDRCRFLGYKGPKSAIQYCKDLNLGVCATADQLESTTQTIHKYADHFKISFKKIND